LTRLGLLGGTFDPPHYGHLVAAHEAAWQLDLERVLFLPARQNPLKRAEPVSDAEIRCQMVQLAIADNPLFELSRVELDRPPPSFTVDMLRGLAAPGCELFFLIGADIIPELPRWHAPLEILSLARLVVVTRAGSAPPDVVQLERTLRGAASRVTVLSIPGVDVSSTLLRSRVREGKPIRYLTPDTVVHFIANHGLYR
jgi:nicotinate-nucleotide adenylyltransferase